VAQTGQKALCLRHPARGEEVSRALYSVVWFYLAGTGMMSLGSPLFIRSFSLQGLNAMERPEAIGPSLGKLLAAGKVSEADSLAQRYLSEQPPSSENFLRIGHIYFEHDQWERAANFFRESIKLQGQNDTAHLLLGLSLSEMKQSAEAERELLIAVQQNPRSDVNCYFAGEQLLRRGKYEASLPYFYKAVELNPKNSGAYRALASALARTGSYGLAENYYKRAISLTEKDGTQTFEPYLDLSYLLLLGNQKEPAARALEYARKAIALNGQSADAHYMCGKALLKLERYSEARDELLTSSHLNPEDARPYFLLAQVHDRLGEAQQARAARQTFARLSKKSATEP
jgi:tetratricopeptide (TPR) repeat protein